MPVGHNSLHKHVCVALTCVCSVFGCTITVFDFLVGLKHASQFFVCVNYALQRARCAVLCRGGDQSDAGLLVKVCEVETQRW